MKFNKEYAKKHPLKGMSIVFGILLIIISILKLITWSYDKWGHI